MKMSNDSLSHVWSILVMGAACQTHQEFPITLKLMGYTAMSTSYPHVLEFLLRIYLTSTRLEMFSCKGIELVTIKPTATLAILLSIFKDFTYIKSHM